MPELSLQKDRCSSANVTDARCCWGETPNVSVNTSRRAISSDQDRGFVGASGSSEPGSQYEQVQFVVVLIITLTSNIKTRQGTPEHWTRRRTGVSWDTQ